MLIFNGKLVLWEQPNQILDGQAIYIKDREIVEIAPQAELMDRYPQEEQVDACGQFVMPGNICAHTHFYGAFARGMAIPGDAAKNFPEILQKLWWPLDQALSLEDVYSSALVCIVDAIRHGTTTLIDHHASPNAIDGSLDVIAHAVLESGVRSSLCYEVTDRGGEERMKAGAAENIRFLKRISRDNANGQLAGMFGLHASLTLSEKTLDYCASVLPSGFGFHVHTAEHISDEDDSRKKCGLRVIDRLNAHNILGPNTIAVHAVQIDAREMQLLAETKTWVTHQPRSNMNNAVGVSSVEDMLRMGIPVCLGNDGFSNAMWEEWKTAYLVHKLWNSDPRRMGGYDVVQMAVYHNAALASQQFGKTIGVLRPGAEADLIFVDYHPYTDLTAGNLPWHILFGFHESMVTATMVAGKFLMKDRKLLTLDEEKITADALQRSRKTWTRYNQQFSQ